MDCIYELSEKIRVTACKTTLPYSKTNKHELRTLTTDVCMSILSVSLAIAETKGALIDKVLEKRRQ